jgi:broad specificity phosphatase PhoE
LNEERAGTIGARGMTTTIFLVRHAAHELLGRVLTGRTPGVRLGELGRAQSQRLAGRLGREQVSALYTSPLERARETAEPIGARLGVAPEVVEGLTDVEYGEWSDQTFEALGGDPRWERWNWAKATCRPPGGESLLDVQWRAVASIERVVEAHPDKGAVLVSHCDVIKSALAYYLGLAIDGILRFEISPASISTIAVGDWGAKVLGVNEVVPE